ncbi:D-alanyl-D-alanine carboxypeptidase family protein [Streptomyces hebeiensis]
MCFRSVPRPSPARLVRTARSVRTAHLVRSGFSARTTHSAPSALLATAVFLATGLLVLLPASAPAAADPRADPATRGASFFVFPGSAGPHGTAVSRTSGLPLPLGARPSPGASTSAGPGAPAASPSVARGTLVDRRLLHRPGTHVRPARGVPRPPELSALSWLVADARTGDVLAAHNAHLELPPASTLKTLFALTALPRLPEHGRHTVTDAELDDIGPNSSTVGIAPGLEYEVADLWRGVFLSSGNDAVRALAAMNGGVDATVAQMREKAKLLGALDTHVVSPDGYDAPGQVSSAFDLAVFGRTGLASPAFVRYSSTRDALFPGDGYMYGIHNTNRLLSGEDGIEPYPGLIGVKNGYTSGAGYTLIAAARHGERTLVVSVMNPQSGWSGAVYEEARELLDWGFKADGKVAPVGSLQPPPPPLPPRPAKAGPEPGPVAQAVRTAPPASSTPGSRPGTASASPPTHALASGDEGGEGGEGALSGVPVPAALTGAACAAAASLFLVRRRWRGRRASASGPGG